MCGTNLTAKKEKKKKITQLKIPIVLVSRSLAMNQHDLHDFYSDPSILLPIWLMSLLTGVLTQGCTIALALGLSQGWVGGAMLGRRSLWGGSQSLIFSPCSLLHQRVKQLQNLQALFFHPELRYSPWLTPSPCLFCLCLLLEIFLPPGTVEIS